MKNETSFFKAFIKGCGAFLLITLAFAVLAIYVPIVAIAEMGGWQGER